jgi:hypothetical protein
MTLPPPRDAAYRQVRATASKRHLKHPPSRDRVINRLDWAAPPYVSNFYPLGEG